MWIVNLKIGLFGLKDLILFILLLILVCFYVGEVEDWGKFLVGDKEFL